MWYNTVSIVKKKISQKNLSTMNNELSKKEKNATCG